MIGDRVYTVSMGIFGNFREFLIVCREFVYHVIALFQLKLQTATVSSL